MKTRTSCLPILVLVMLLPSLAPGAGAGAESRLAERIMGNAGVKGGLIVHIGCGDGKLTAALHTGEEYLVHGTDPDQANVDEARRHIRSLGLYGDVSVARLEGKHLPYVDDLVNLVVSRNLGDIPMDEVMRVLCPNGVAFIRENG